MCAALLPNAMSVRSRSSATAAATAVTARDGRPIRDRMKLYDVLQYFAKT